MMGRLIKAAAETAAREAVSFGLLSGTVETISPLAVRVDERFLLEEEYLVLPHFLLEQKLTVGGAHSGSTVLQKGLAVGDKVILLEVSGRFLVMGKEEGDGAVQLTIA